MKPFDLKLALNGDPVCYRSGEKVSEIIKIEVDHFYQLISINENKDNWHTHNMEGNIYATGSSSIHDLFMAPKTKTYYVNIYQNLLRAPSLWCGEICSEKAMSDFRYKDEHAHFLKTISFEIED